MTTLDNIHAAPIEILLEARGFHHEKNRWTCHAHDDHRPSCTIRNNRLRCWVCDRWGSAIDLVMELDGVDLKTAVRYVAAFYNITDDPMVPADRRRYARARAGTDALTQRLANFAYGLEIAVHRPLKLSEWLLEIGLDPAAALGEFHRQAHVLRQAKPAEIAALWRTTPENARAAIERIGCADREHAERITNIIIDLLERSQAKAAA